MKYGSWIGVNFSSEIQLPDIFRLIDQINISRLPKAGEKPAGTLRVLDIFLPKPILESFFFD